MRYTRMVFGCLMAVALCGCGLTAAQKQGLTQFGTSTSSYADKVSMAATGVQTDINQIRLDSLGLPTKEAEKLFNKHVKEIQDDKDGVTFAKYIDNEKLSKHIEMIKGLASGLKGYGQALVDLANYGDQKGRLGTIQGIATNLNSAMGSKVAKDQADAIGMVIAYVSNEIIEAVKKEDIKKIVAKFGPAVKSAVALLRAEFVGKQEGTLLYAYKAEIDTYADRLPSPTKGTVADARLAALKALSDVKEKDTSSAKAAAFVAYRAAADTRREIAVGRSKLHNMQARLAVMQKQGLEATDALDAANDKMMATLANGSLSFTDIQDFAQKAEAFGQAINSLIK